MYHVWCTHSPGARHLGYCYHLPTVNNAAAGISVQAFVWPCVFTPLGYIPGGELWGPVGSCLTPEIVRMFSKAVAPFYTHTAADMGADFSASSPTLGGVCLFNESHPSGCWGNLTAVLITNEVQHCSTRLLAVSASHRGGCPLGDFVQSHR